MKNPQPVSPLEALEKLQQFCAYQERCHREVRSKLIRLGIYGQDLEDIMAGLIAGNFLNEERYARSFARGKFRMKHWGKNRIRQELKGRDIADYCIEKAMEEIGEQEYQQALEQVIRKKNALLKESSPFKRKNKLAQFAIRRGFEAELVWPAIGRLFD